MHNVGFISPAGLFWYRGAAFASIVGTFFLAIAAGAPAAVMAACIVAAICAIEIASVFRDGRYGWLMALGSGILAIFFCGSIVAALLGDRRKPQRWIPRWAIGIFCASVAEAASLTLALGLAGARLAQPETAAAAGCAAFAIQSFIFALVILGAPPP